jgi:glucose-6-phosphate 1-dehydrogenase
MNRAINLSKRLDSEFAEKLNAVDEFSKYDLSEINDNENVRYRKHEPVLIQKITTNSPIEITINIDCYVHIAIILLGGKRIDSNIYEIPIRIIENFRDLFDKIREQKNRN